MTTKLTHFLCSHQWLSLYLLHCRTTRTYSLTQKLFPVSRSHRRSLPSTPAEHTIEGSVGHGRTTAHCILVPLAIAKETNNTNDKKKKHAWKHTEPPPPTNPFLLRSLTMAGGSSPMSAQQRQRSMSPMAQQQWQEQGDDDDQMNMKKTIRISIISLCFSWTMAFAYWQKMTRNNLVYRARETAVTCRPISRRTIRIRHLKREAAKLHLKV